MTYEKSCGAIIFRRKEKTEYLLIFNKKGSATGHWGFPKGHVEGNETELETAKREVAEETGIYPTFIDGFRMVSRYSIHNFISKDAVYFLAEFISGTVVIQESELSDYRWCDFEEACNLITFDKKYLTEAKDFISKNC